MGLTNQGYERKTFEQHRDDIKAALIADLGPETNVSDTSVLGVIVGIAAERLAQLDEVGHAIYTAQDPDQATGDALDTIAALTGTTRRAATKSTVTATVNLDDGTDIAVGEAVASVRSRGDWAGRGECRLAYRSRNQPVRVELRHERGRRRFGR